METNNSLDLFINSLFSYLTGTQPLDKVKIFRKYTYRLDICGDISFPLNISAWKSYINIDEPSLDVPIVTYTTKFDQQTLNPCDFEDLINNSKAWVISIAKCAVVNDKKLSIFLDRVSTFKLATKTILLEAEKYGNQTLSFPSNIEIRVENKTDDLSTMDLTQLRINLVSDVAVNLLKACGGGQAENADSDVIYLTNTSESELQGKKIVCGVVIDNKCGKKNIGMTAAEFYSTRKVHMQLMSQHKYGIRVNSESGWPDFFKQLADAVVTIDLLHIKPCRQVVVNVDNPTCAYSRGASFTLYNCARIAMIFRHFNERIQAGLYPGLPELDDVDFSLLKEPEEWQILYVHLMHFPQTVAGAIKDIAECKLDTQHLCRFLDALCASYSLYYQRIRLLTTVPEPHLLPVLYARIYLLKAVQQVLHNALALLNIAPIAQM